MSSTPQKQTLKMCKSPKTSSSSFPNKEKIMMNEYESLSTNCTTVGSNNLHLVKKPQVMTSPAYSNPSPNYPHSPYNSPVGLKSPSPQSMKPPTPQPNSFPVILHNNHPLLTRQIQTGQPQNIIKLKPHLNILPKPAASPQPSPKPSVSPQIVIPTNQQATLMPAAQPLLLNQMPVLTTPGVQFILRPQTKMPTQMQTATATPQGLILQPSNQQLLHLQPPRSQPLVRVLTNGMQLAPPTTTYVTHLASPSQGHSNISHGMLINAQHPALPKKKPKKKKQKLDLANIMKLSGIGDEDDIQFESDTSQSESDHNSVHSQPNTPQPQPTVIQQQANLMHSQPNIVQTQANILQSADAKKMGNIHISAVQQPTINTAPTPLVQVLNQSFQSGVIPTSQAATPQSIPFNSFITPNFTINNGLMVQRSGGFKLTLGEDGRLILQHDPTLNQDLQSQILLQSLFGLNSLLLQPSMDQQVHSQTVQTIQQQSVQTIQQQTVQSQTIQTVQQQTVQPQSVQHSLQTIQQTIQPQIQTVQPQTVQQTVQQTIQHQTVQSQPLAALQQHTQPMQIVQPQPIQNLNQSIQSQTVHSIQSQVQPTLHSIQSQLQGQIQSQIQGQIQSLLQSQLHSQNISQSQSLNLQSQPIQTVQSQPMQTVQSQPLIVHSQPMQISHSLSQPITIQSQPIQTIQTQVSHSQPIHAQPMHSVMHAVQSQPVHNIQTQTMQPIQTIQSQIQPVQTIQSQPMQTIQQQQQPIQSQPVLKVQPFQKSQPPVQTVHPQPVQTIHHQPNQLNETQNPPPTSYVVNLTPDQLEQLKRNGQVTVNGQTIFMQRTNANKLPEVGTNTDGNKPVKLSPKIKPVKKINKVANIKSVIQDASGKNVEKINNVKETKSSLVTALQTPPKHILPQNHVQVQPQQSIQPILQKPTTQPSALVQPSVQTITQNQLPPKVHVQQPKVPIQPQTQTNHAAQTENAPPQDVEHLLGQIIEETGTAAQVVNQGVQTTPNHTQPTQRVHTIQLTPQKQQHLKSIQLQIHTLTARLTPGDTEMHNALKLLFQEQQKILATGKLLPPDKVYYHNNQLTILNPSTLNLSAVQTKQPEPVVNQNVARTTIADTNSSHSVVTTQSLKVSSSDPPTPNSVHPVPAPPQAIGPRPLPTTAPPHPVPQHHQQQQQQQQHQQQQQQQHRFIPTFTKAQLIEQQLNTDQNGAVKPDVGTPFKDKADACKRLIRYHCFDQPILSSKDLNKADEIFELTAKHFIDKFSKMVDKYRFLRLKESMRQVQTSELMMLDRMFLAEEQQSLIRLRQDGQDPPAPSIEITPPPSQSSQQTTDSNQDEYDEWACIQKELGCLPPSDGAGKSPSQESQAPKRSASSDSRLEMLKKFRVDKHHKKCTESVGVNSLAVPGIQTSISRANSIQNSPHAGNVHGSPHSLHASSPSAVSSVSHSMQQLPHISAISSQFSQHNVQNSQNSQHSVQNSQHSRQMTHIHSVHSSQQTQQRSLHHNQNIHDMQHFSHSTQHIVQSTLHATQHITHTVHHTQHIHNAQQNLSAHNVHNAYNVQAHGSTASGNGTDNIIDEQVQSAIDSILNLQQSSLDLDDAVSSILS